MYKYLFNPRRIQRSFSHIGPKFHNRGRMVWKHNGCPLNLFGKTIVFIGITGIIINSADKDTLAAVVASGQRR